MASNPQTLIHQTRIICAGCGLPRGSVRCSRKWLHVFNMARVCINDLHAAAKSYLNVNFYLAFAHNLVAPDSSMELEHRVSSFRSCLDVWFGSTARPTTCLSAFGLE